HVPSNWPIHSTSGHTQNQSNACGVSPFGHPGLTVWLSTPPGLSQIPTSFIGSYYQGIHRAPLPTYPTNNPTKQGHQPHKPQIEQIQQPNQRWLPSHRYNHYKTDTPTHNRPACRTLNKMLASTIQLPQQHPTNTNHNPNTDLVNDSTNNYSLFNASIHQSITVCRNKQLNTKTLTPAARQQNQPIPTTQPMVRTTSQNVQNPANDTKAHNTPLA